MIAIYIVGGYVSGCYCPDHRDDQFSDVNTIVKPWLSNPRSSLDLGVVMRSCLCDGVSVGPYVGTEQPQPVANSKPTDEEEVHKSLGSGIEWHSTM